MIGKQFEFENATISSISVEKEKNYYDTFGKSFNGLITKNQFELELEIKTKNITRKRFIKLLMAKGIQRNGANEIAKYILKKYGYYNSLLIAFL